MTTTLPVTPRDESTTADALRANGAVPAVVYGPKQEPIGITVDAKVFDKVRQAAGESTIVELTGLKESVEVLIKDIAFDPVKQRVTHVDFYAIERGKEMTTHVPLHFIGEAPVEKSGLGTVTKVHQDLTVTCRPSALPSHIDVDVSSLAAVEDKILVKDLALPKEVKVEAEADEPVAVVSVAKEEVEETPEAVDMDAIEVEQKGKEETADSAAEEKAA